MKIVFSKLNWELWSVRVDGKLEGALIHQRFEPEFNMAYKVIMDGGPILGPFKTQQLARRGVEKHMKERNDEEFS